MSTDPQTDYTAELAERTIVVTWPDNERGGATPPPDGWQEHAREQESTLHEIDEGSITGCSVLRWRDDSRPDAELIAVSLALVTGKPAAVSAVPSAPVDRPELRDRIAAAVDEGFRLYAELEDTSLGDSITDSVLAAVLAEPPPADRAATLRELEQRYRPNTPPSRPELRRMADEEQQQPETHVYLSTGCLHGDHDYCKSMTGLAGAKRPGECKQCGAKCICGCHRGEEQPVPSVHGESVAHLAALNDEEQPATAPVHVGGNAEDCPACSGTNPPYPFICPGPDAAFEADRDSKTSPKADSKAEVVHACPPDGSGLTPCCGRTPFELPLSDRISSEATVTCPGAAVAEPGKEA